jgi:hypothetical protein
MILLIFSLIWFGSSLIAIILVEVFPCESDNPEDLKVKHIPGLLLAIMLGLIFVGVVIYDRRKSIANLIRKFGEITLKYHQQRDWKYKR